uniref:Uncharacterized protein n=1 Tax=Fagus sylvatica TaxID=28930 RepID=A0A2N9G661_FAGSY
MMNKTSLPIQNQPHEDLEQNQLPIPTEKTLIVDLPSSPSKAVKRGKPAKKKVKAAMVDLASSLSKGVKRGRPAKNEGKAAMVDLASSPSKGVMVDLVSSPSKGVPFMRYTREKTRAQKNLMIVPHQPESVRIQSIDTNEWVDAHFLYQPTADDQSVLADLRRKGLLATKRISIPFIGKEDHQTDRYNSASGDGVLRPPANRTAPQLVLFSASLSLSGSRRLSLSHTFTSHHSPARSKQGFFCSSRPAASRNAQVPIYYPTTNKSTVNTG